jgi:ABC-2 type transport system permease protein
VLIMAPVLMLTTAVIGLLTGAAGQVPAALGVVAAGLGVSTGVTALVSVIAPYAFPESMNPFAVSSGTGSARGLVALLGSVGTLVLACPLILFAVLTHGPGLGLLVLGAGAVWGAAGLLLGTHIGGGILDRRGPEILVAVTPRR